VITTAEAAAGSVPGVIHAHARARRTGRTLRVEIEGWVDPEISSETPARWAVSSPTRSRSSPPGRQLYLADTGSVSLTTSMSKVRAGVAERLTVLAAGKCVAACRRAILRWACRAARYVLCIRKEVLAMFANRQTPPGVAL
jgi:hypothetical protein